MEFILNLYRDVCIITISINLLLFIILHTLIAFNIIYYNTSMQ